MRERAAGKPVQGIVILDPAGKAEFGGFRQDAYDAYLVRPVRPQSILTLVGARAEPQGEEAGDPLPQRPAQGASREKTPSVLLVEDNDINALLARRILEKTGCEVRACLNGRDAVEACRRVLAGIDAGYDLVLMDVHMPVLDGLEATRVIKGLYAQAGNGPEPPPIVALTANAFEEDRQRCLEAGMDDYLAKPFDRDDLVRLLERWCGDPARRPSRAA
jgi:CheY-like chemotaxis protein